MWRKVMWGCWGMMFYQQIFSPKNINNLGFFKWYTQCVCWPELPYLFCQLLYKTRISNPQWLRILDIIRHAWKKYHMLWFDFRPIWNIITPPNKFEKFVVQSREDLAEFNLSPIWIFNLNFVGFVWEINLVCNKLY